MIKVRELKERDDILIEQVKIKFLKLQFRKIKSESFNLSKNKERKGMNSVLKARTPRNPPVILQL